MQSLDEFLESQGLQQPCEGETPRTAAPQDTPAASADGLPPFEEDADSDEEGLLSGPAPASQSHADTTPLASRLRDSSQARSVQ